MNTSTRNCFSPSAPPPGIASQPIWACYRRRQKAGRKNPIFQPVHPITGAEPKVNDPAGWTTYDEATRPRLRRPVDGIGLVVTQESGLAVVLEADPGVPARLGDNVFYSEKSATGTGLTVIVRHGQVLGAVTDRFVPLSGQSPCPDPTGVSATTSLDAVWTLSGQVTGRTQEPDPQNQGEIGSVWTSAVPSSPLSLQDIIGDHGEEGQPLGAHLSDFAAELIAQEKAGGADDWDWLYGVIAVLRAAGLKPETTEVHLLREFADLVGKNVLDLHAKVLARWDRFDPSKVRLSDALRVVRVNPSLFDGLAVADPYTLVLAGMAKYMGSGGRRFRLNQVALAEVLGLRNQQAASDHVHSLLNMKWLTLKSAHRFRGEKGGKPRDAEYVWTGPGAVPEASAAVPAITATATPSKTPYPPLAALPLPPEADVTVRRSPRPGHSFERDDVHRLESKLGGYLTYEHYLAEMMMARKLQKEGEGDLAKGFWVRHKKDHDWQVVCARRLLKKYLPAAVTAACKADKKLYSLSAPWFEDEVKAHDVSIRREQTKLAKDIAEDKERERDKQKLLTSGRLLPAGSRPAFIPKKSSLGNLKGL